MPGGRTIEPRRQVAPAPMLTFTQRQLTLEALPMHQATIHAHSTPDPEVPPATEPDPAPPVTVPVPDDVPAPTHAPVTEPGMPEPPMRAAC